MPNPLTHFIMTHAVKGVPASLAVSPRNAIKRFIGSHGDNAFELSENTNIVSKASTQGY